MQAKDDKKCDAKKCDRKYRSPLPKCLVKALNAWNAFLFFVISSPFLLLFFLLSFCVDLPRARWTPQILKFVFGFTPVFNHHKFFDEKDVPDMSGRVILITGGNSGLGLENARVLAGKGGKVIIACRSKERAEEAVRSVKAGFQQEVDIEYMLLDLASLTSVRTFASDFLSKYSRLDVLLLNAGKILEEPQLTDDGYEWMFGAHHMSHFYLTHLLAGALKTSAEEGGDTRVVVLSSCAHQTPLKKGIDFDRLKIAEPPCRSSLFNVYGTSKLANALFCRKLAQKIQNSSLNNKIFVNAVHPGFARTNLISDAPPKCGCLYRLLTYSAEKAALTQLYLAAGKDAKFSDSYLIPLATPCQWKRDCHPHTCDWTLIDKLWDYSVQELRAFDSTFQEGF